MRKTFAVEWRLGCILLPGMLLAQTTVGIGQNSVPLNILTNTGALPTNAVEMPAPIPPPAPFTVTDSTFTNYPMSFYRALYLP